MKLINAIGGRKVVFGFIVMGVGTAVDLVTPGGLSRTLMELLQYIGVGFFLGNGAEHVAQSMSKKKSDGSDEALDEIKASQQAIYEQMANVQAIQSKTNEAVTMIIKRYNIT